MRCLCTYTVLGLIVNAVVKAQHKEVECANFMSSSYHLQKIDNAWQCNKHDGIAGVFCRKPVQLRSNISDISKSKLIDSSLKWDSVLIYMLAGHQVKSFIFQWWLQFLSPELNIDLALIAEACPPQQRDPSPVSCNDSAQAFVNTFKDSHKNIRFHIERAQHSVDTGVARLACKIATGMKKLFSAFPLKKYFFKIDGMVSVGNEMN